MSDVRAGHALALVLFLALPLAPAAAAPVAAPAAAGATVDRGASICRRCHTTFVTERVAAFLTSVHRSLECGACHLESGDHDAARARRYALSVCRDCHSLAARELAASVHHTEGSPTVALFARGCLTCHGDAHTIDAGRAKHGKDAMCLACHGDAAFMGTIGLSSAIGSTFRESVHGQRRVLGDAKAPGCTDCHGAHGVRRVDDPASPLSPERRVATCARCHPGATPLFAQSVTHRPPDLGHRPVAWAVSLVYSVLILFTLCFFSLIIALELGSQIVRALVRRPLERPAPSDAIRLDVNQRWQHAVGLASVITLVLTGVPLLVAGVAGDTGVIALLGGVDRAAAVHRVAGVVLMALVAWHLAWLAWTARRDGWTWSMMPRWADVLELRDELAVYVLCAHELPRREGKYGWVEKLEYLAFAWGAMVMGMTGLILWFPVRASMLLPAGGLPVAQIIHGFEAILATMSVFLWHLYQVHLKPGVFPMSWTWLVGHDSRATLR